MSLEYLFDWGQIFLHLTIQGCQKQIFAGQFLPLATILAAYGAWYCLKNGAKKGIGSELRISSVNQWQFRLIESWHG